jgi:hypothetical protein
VLTRGLVAMLMLLLLVVPTVQLMSPVSVNFVHQLHAKAGAKISGGSRTLVVTGGTSAPNYAPLVIGRVNIADRNAAGPGFFADPFVPPRA